MYHALCSAVSVSTAFQMFYVRSSSASNVARHRALFCFSKNVVFGCGRAWPPCSVYCYASNVCIRCGGTL